MKSFWLLLACVLPSMCFAQTPTVNYKLYKDYILEFNGKTKFGYWSYTSGCIDSSGNAHSATGGGSVSYPMSVYGILTFNSTTGLGITLTMNVFDQSKSNATVQITWGADCSGPTINNGYAVFDPPITTSAIGSYTINATDGTGTLSFSGLVALFQTTGSFASCASGNTIYVIPNTIMLEVLSPKYPNLIAGTGIAEHANGVILACPF
jgi:hypothetical protein